GIRNTHAWSQVIRNLGDVESVFVPTGSTDAHFRLDLTEEEQEILGHVNGRSTVEQICDVSYLSTFETCRILWGLQVVAMIRGRPPPRAAQEPDGVGAQRARLRDPARGADAARRGGGGRHLRHHQGWAAEARDGLTGPQV